MQNYKIPRTEILKLYESSLNEVSAHSVGQWLKSKTDKQYIIVPSSLIHSIPEKVRKSIKSIENTKIELEDLVQNHQEIFDKWL